MKCKRGRYHPTRIETASAENLVATGETKVLRSYHGRHRVTMYQIKHTTCGHVMWTNHSDGERLFNRRQEG